jgi:transposase
MAASPRIAKKMTRRDKIDRAKDMFRSGMSYRQIGSTINVNEGTAYNYVNDYPYGKKAKLAG